MIKAIVINLLLTKPLHILSPCCIFTSPSQPLKLKHIKLNKQISKCILIIKISTQLKNWKMPTQDTLTKQTIRRINTRLVRPRSFNIECLVEEFVFGRQSIRWFRGSTCLVYRMLCNFCNSHPSGAICVSDIVARRCYLLSRAAFPRKINGGQAARGGRGTVYY